MTTFASLAIEYTTNTAAKAAQEMSALERAAKSLEDASVSLKETSEKLGEGKDKLGQKTRRATDQLNAMQGVAGRLIGVLASLGLAMGFRQITQYADAWSDLQSRLGSAIKDMSAAPRVMEDMVRLANSSYSPLEQTVEIFSRNVVVMKELGFTTQQTVDFTEGLNHALVITATRGERAASVQHALAKAMAVGKLGGEGLETVLANAGEVAERLAAELGTTVNGLREFASNGAITTEVIARAMIKPLDELRAKAAEMPATIQDAFVRLQNNLTAYIGQADQANGASAALANIIFFLADNIGIVSNVLLVMAATRIPIFIAGMAGATAATTAFGAALSLVGGWPGLIVAGIAALGLGLYSFMQGSDQARAAVDALNTSLDAERSRLEALVREMAPGVRMSREMATAKLAEAQAILVGMDAKRQEAAELVKQTAEYQHLSEQINVLNGVLKTWEEQNAMEARTGATAEQMTQLGLAAAHVQGEIEKLIAAQANMVAEAGAVSPELQALIDRVAEIARQLAETTGDVITFGGALDDTGRSMERAASQAYAMIPAATELALRYGELAGAARAMLEAQNAAALEDNRVKFEQLVTTAAGLVDKLGLSAGEAAALRSEITTLGTSSGLADQAVAAQRIAEEMLAAVGNTAEMPKEVREAYNMLVAYGLETAAVNQLTRQTAEGLRDAESAARGLASAMAAAAGFSASIDSAVRTLKVEIDALKSGADAALAVMVATRTEQARAIHAKQVMAAVTEEQIFAANIELAINMAQIEELKKQTAERDRLAKSMKSAGGASKNLTEQLKKEGEAFKASIDPLFKYNQELAKLDELLSAEEINEGQHSAGVDELNKALVESIPLAGELTDILVDGLFNGFKDTMSRLKDMFKRWLAELIATAIRNKIIVPIITAMGGSVGGTVAAAAGSALTGGAGGVGGGLVGGAAGSAGAGLLGSFGAEGTILGMTGLGGGVGLLGGFGNAISGGLSNIFAVGANAQLAGGSIMATIGAIAAPLLIVGAIAAALIGSKKVKNTGMRIMAGEDWTYTDHFTTTQKSYAFGLVKGGNKTSYSAASDDTQRYISDAVGSLQDAIETSAEYLGLGAEAFKGFYTEVKFSTHNMSDEAAQQAVQNVIQQIADAYAWRVMEQYQDYIKEGEFAADAIQRLAVSLQVVNATFDMLNKSLLDVSIMSAAAASDLLEMVGGVENWASLHDAYVQAFYSAEEQLALFAQQVAASFEPLGIAVPETREAYRALVEAQDMTTEAGREMYAALLMLAPTFDQLRQMTEQVEEAERQRTEALLEEERALSEVIAREQEAAANERYRLETQILQLLGDTNALRERELALLFENNQPLQLRIWALQDAAAAEQAAAQAATEAARAVDEFRRSLSDAANVALNDLQKAINAEIQRSEVILDADLLLIEAQRTAAEERLDLVRAELDQSIALAREGMQARIEVLREEASARQSILATAQAALSAAQSGVDALRFVAPGMQALHRDAAALELRRMATGSGPLDADRISQVMNALRPDTSLFSTEADFIRSAAGNLHLAQMTEARAQRQVTAEEKLLAQIEAKIEQTTIQGEAEIAALQLQIEQAEKQFADRTDLLDQQEMVAQSRHSDLIRALDEQMAQAQMEVEIALGTYRATLSVADAVLGVRAAIKALADSELFSPTPVVELAAPPASSNITPPAAAATTATQSETAALRQEVKALSETLAGFLRPISTNTAKVAQVMRDWDEDGMPAERGA